MCCRPLIKVRPELIADLWKDRIQKKNDIAAAKENSMNFDLCLYLSSTMLRPAPVDAPNATSSHSTKTEDMKHDERRGTSEVKQDTDLDLQRTEELQETNSTFKHENQKSKLSDLEQQEYFRQFFANEETAGKAFNHVEQNINLHSLCENVSYCAIVCASLGHYFTQKCPRDAKPPVTITHLLSIYLCNTFRRASGQIKDHLHFLLKLCELAYEGNSMETSTFDDLSCRQKFQQHELQSLFLAEIIKKDNSSAGITHKFVHQPVQDFLAAVGLFLATGPDDLIKLVETHYSQKEESSVTFLRFLFGLCSPVSSLIMEEYTGLFPGETICRLTEFLKSRVQVGIQNMNNELRKVELLGTLCYLYETQNQELASVAIGSVKQLAFGGWRPVRLTPINCTGIAFGLQFCHTVEDLNLNKCNIGDGGLHRLLPVLHKCKVLRLNENKLSDMSSKEIVGALTQGDCQIRTLELWDNHLTHVGAEHLASALRMNQSLQVLVLSHNRLEDSGARKLTAALRDPGCKIKILRLDCNGLTDACADDIACSACGSWSLMGLDLDRNYFTDKSIAPFVRLVKTSTGLKWIRLADNSFTTFGKRQLGSVQQTRERLEVWV
ncbi:NACHT, LRR and PYD domains-containing protein 3-like [Mustelus asterias]